MKAKHRKDCETRYLKKFELVETETELPIQGQVRDPEDLFLFFKQLHNEQVPKIIGIFLDANNLFLGNQIFSGTEPKTFDTQVLYHYYALFYAKKYIVIINHPSGDPAPTEDDARLWNVLQSDSQLISFKPFLEDFIIVGEKKYISMTTNIGNTCRCRHQQYF